MSDRIKICLRKRNMKLKDLSVAASIPLSTLSDIVNDKTKKLDVQKASDLSKALGCTLDYLVDADQVSLDDTYGVVSLGQALIDERKKQGFTRKELSTATGIPVDIIRSFEKGDADINLFLLESICEAYGISVARFYFDHDFYDEYIPSPFSDGSEIDVEGWEAFKKARDEDAMKDSVAHPEYRNRRSTSPDDLSPREEREIARDLEDMMHSMASAAYEGDQLEDVEAFKATIKAAMIQAKKLAKAKYTPKKYRK